jgi:putative hydrolase of HD superfamily
MKKDLELLYEIGTLRFIPRAWIQMIPDMANLAEHHLRVIWLALIISRQEKVKNLEKVMLMALIHDIAESRTGDVHYLSRQYTTRNEKLAMEDILQQTSEVSLLKLWAEYEDKKTLEAKIVKDADNLDVDLELKESEFRGNKLPAIFNKDHRKLIGRNLYTKTGKKLWQLIQTSNPHDWHLKGRNRYNAGDWKKLRKK